MKLIRVLPLFTVSRLLNGNVLLPLQCRIYRFNSSNSFSDCRPVIDFGCLLVYFGTIMWHYWVWSLVTWIAWNRFMSDLDHVVGDLGQI